MDIWLDPAQNIETNCSSFGSSNFQAVRLVENKFDQKSDSGHGSNRVFVKLQNIAFDYGILHAIHVHDF